MYKRIILKHLNKLTIIDVKKFGLEHGVVLDDYEANLLLDITKNNFDLLITNHKVIFDQLYNQMSYQKVKKIEEIFFYYKNKYSHYL